MAEQAIQEKLKNRVFLCSWDDGNAEDFRMIQLLLEYELPAIFYITNTTNLSRRQILDIHNFGFGIGGHTVHHPEDMKKLDPREQFWQIKANKDWLEGIIHQRIFSFCYPAGRHNDKTIEMVKMAGFTEARAVGWGNIKTPDNPFKIIPTAFIHSDSRKFGNKTWLRYAKMMFEKDWKYYHLWGHTKDITDYGMWGQVEEFFEFIKQSDKYESIRQRD